MRIGCPKEIKPQEGRVGLTPAGVDALVRAGHEVFVEQNAGIESGFSGMQALCLGVCFVILFIIELIHEKRKTLTQLTDRLPYAARWLLYLLAVMAIVIFGVWGPGYNAQAFIYFQF